MKVNFTPQIFLLSAFFLIFLSLPEVAYANMLTPLEWYVNDNPFGAFLFFLIPTLLGNLIIELPIYLIFKLRGIRLITGVIFANFISVFLLYCTIRYIMWPLHLGIFLILELCVVGIESLIIHLVSRSFGLKKVALVCLLANSLSVIIGGGFFWGMGLPLF